MDKQKKSQDDWIRLSSKSRPGRFYLFNKATGETQWLPLKPNEHEEKESPPKLSINKVAKTPAQDRLKRLQHSLKICQTKSNTSASKPKILKEQQNELYDRPSTSASAKTTTTSPRKASKRIYDDSFSSEKPEQQNKFNDGPSTSSCSKTTTTSPRKASKRSYVESFTSKKPESYKCVKSLQDNCHKLPLPSSLSDDIKPSTSKGLDTESVCAENPHSSKETTSEDNFKVNHSKCDNTRSGIFKKIKEVCKLPFKKKASDDNLLSKRDSSFGLLNSTKFKTTTRLKSKQLPSTSTPQKTVYNQLKQDKRKSPEKIFTSSFPKETPTKQSIPQYPRGSANSRLERLKQSLLMQQQICSTTASPSENNSTETNNNKISTIQTDFNINSTESPNTSNHSFEIAKKDDLEAMDWQPIPKDNSPIENNNTLVVEKSKKLLLRENICDDNSTIGDIIDAVNENLLRFSAEKQKNSFNNNKKWQTDHYYFVVDTNVLLRDLTFIEDLTKMRLCETKGSVLYIPYSVLQELDKLKMRSGCQEGVKTLAVRAIKYLNSKLENNSSHVQAQSAIEERQHLIDVNSADDSIINSCLQAKKHVPNIILLTEDVNLRNKAISNNIIVSTKSDLVTKRYESRDVS